MVWHAGDSGHIAEHNLLDDRLSTAESELAGTTPIGSLRLGNATQTDYDGAPLISLQEIVYIGGSGPVSGLLVQGHRHITKYFNKTNDDTQQADSHQVILVATTGLWVPVKPTLADEADVLVQGGLKLKGYATRAIGHIASVVTQNSGSEVDFAHAWDVASTSAKDTGTIVRQFVCYSAEDVTSGISGKVGAVWGIRVPQPIHTNNALCIAAYTGVEGHMASASNIGDTSVTLETGHGAGGFRPSSPFTAGQTVQVDIGKNAELVTISTVVGDVLTFTTALKKAHSQYCWVAVVDSNGFGMFYMTNNQIKTESVVLGQAFQGHQFVVDSTDGSGFYQLQGQTTGTPGTPNANTSRLYQRSDGRLVHKVPNADVRVVNYRPFLPSFASGRWYGSGGSINSTSGAQGNGSLRASAFLVSETTTFDGIGCEITVVGSSGALIRLGIYSDDGTGQPGSLVLDAGTVDATILSTTTDRTIAISQQLTPGVYWLAAVIQGSPSTQPTVRVNTLPDPAVPIGGSTALSVGSSTGFLHNATVNSGALPGTFVVSSPVASTTRVMVKAH